MYQEVQTLGVVSDAACHTAEEWRRVCFGGKRNAVEGPETLRSFAKFTSVLAQVP